MFGAQVDIGYFLFLPGVQVASTTAYLKRVSSSSSRSSDGEESLKLSKLKMLVLKI